MSLCQICNSTVINNAIYVESAVEKMQNWTFLSLFMIMNTLCVCVLGVLLVFICGLSVQSNCIHLWFITDLLLFNFWGVFALIFLGIAFFTYFLLCIILCVDCFCTWVHVFVLEKLRKCAFAYDSLIILRWPCVVDRTVKAKY